MLRSSVETHQGLRVSGEEEMGMIKDEEDMKGLKAKENQKEEADDALGATRPARYRART